MVVDYLGNKFRSVAEMCRHHGVNVATYKRRLSEGKSNKEALTLTANQKLRKSGIFDYDKRHFNSVVDYD